MSPEELLKPRYKVIADYPKSLYHVGDILDAGWRSEDCIYCDTEGPRWRHYPHLFKKLAWWEEREEKDMPEYVIQRDMEDSGGNPLPDLVIKIKKHFSAGNGEWRDDSYRIFASDIPLATWVKSYSYAGFEPATESEYNEYLKQSKK